MAPAPQAARRSKKQSAVKTARTSAAGAAAKPAAGKRGSAAKAPTAKAASAPAAARRKHIPAAPAAAAAPPDLYSSLHALLHTMRLIEQHDEPLCSMHDELKRTGRLSAAQRRRLQRLVDELPAEDYQADLETLRHAVDAEASSAA